jgi:hypothetical protein
MSRASVDRGMGFDLVVFIGYRFFSLFDILL